MFRRVLPFLAFGLLATTLHAAPPDAGLTAEATDTVRLAPDTAKVHFVVESKDADSTAAADANAKLKKELTDALDKLAIKGLAVKAGPRAVSRESSKTNNFGGGVAVPGGGQPPVVETVNMALPLTVTLTDTNAEKLVDAVEKVLQTAAGLGVSGSSAGGTNAYNPFTQVTNGRAKVVYSSKGGWDAAEAGGLATAAARAKAKAAALAKGAGVELGALVSVQEVPDASAATAEAAPTNPYAVLLGTGGAAAKSDETPLVDGELVRTVRVRVTYAVK